MKFAVICLLVVLAVAEISAQNHSVEWGAAGPNDRLMFRETIVKKSAWLQIVKKDIYYLGSTIITSIKCTDKYTDGIGGYATLYNGGPGQNSADIHLESQRNHGINFVVEVYGENN